MVNMKEKGGAKSREEKMGIYCREKGEVKGETEEKMKIKYGKCGSSLKLERRCSGGERERERPRQRERKIYKERYER